MLVRDLSRYDFVLKVLLLLATIYLLSPVSLPFLPPNKD